MAVTMRDDATMFTPNRVTVTRQFLQCLCTISATKLHEVVADSKKVMHTPTILH